MQHCENLNPKVNKCVIIMKYTNIYKWTVYLLKTVNKCIFGLRFDNMGSDVQFKD